MLPHQNAKQLLICEGDACNAQFVDEIDDALTGDAASLPSALKAHKAGWKIIDSKILCPSCAGKIEGPARL